MVIKPVLSSSASVMTEMVSPFHRVPALFVLPPNVVTHPLPGKTLSGHGISTSVDVAWAGAAAATASTGTAQADAFASVRRLMTLFSCTVIYPPVDAGLKTVWSRESKRTRTGVPYALDRSELWLEIQSDGRGSEPRER